MSAALEARRDVDDGGGAGAELWGSRWCGKRRSWEGSFTFLLTAAKAQHGGFAARRPTAAASTRPGHAEPARTLTNVPPFRLEKNANALQKEAKAYLDAVRSLSASSTRIATTIDLFYGSDAGEQAMAATAYKRAVEEMEGSVSRGIVSPASLCEEGGS